jgi:ATP phosphoribosyltransferase
LPPPTLNILQKFLDEQNIKAEIHVISGSVEIAPGIGLADAIFDIVSSGSTLVSNRLKEVEVVIHSEAVLIAKPNLSVEKQEILDELIFRLESVQRAEGKKYILLNTPNEKIQEVASCSPA